MYFTTKEIIDIIERVLILFTGYSDIKLNTKTTFRDIYDRYEMDEVEADEFLSYLSSEVGENLSYYDLDSDQTLMKFTSWVNEVNQIL